ncbi:MAG TPA: PP2C family protein-serine/threonine phosphatase [Vicinamibacterales bacterium]|nr:PP2C family protein-serine/threonine phosphatase [Vicinamibacterales bacterium]
MSGTIQPVSETARDRDLRTAGHLQRMLLPPSPLLANGWTAVHHFEPAGAVSGDYLDLVPIGGRLYFMLGDVSGKGVAASLLMAQLHAMFRTLIPFQMPLADLMTRASALLCASSLPAQYATLVTGYLDADGEVSIVNAGHPPPLLIASQGHTEIRATGVPVGLLCESRFSSTRLTVDPGDTLFVYTDGLTEARNCSGDEYGIARVEQSAARAARRSVADLVSTVAADQAAFRERCPNADDVAVLGIRRM